MRQQSKGFFLFLILYLFVDRLPTTTTFDHLSLLFHVYIYQFFIFIKKYFFVFFEEYWTLGEIIFISKVFCNI